MADADKLYMIIRFHGTKEVKIDNVKLLCDVYGTEIPALKPGEGI